MLEHLEAAKRILLSQLAGKRARRRRGEHGAGK